MPNILVTDIDGTLANDAWRTTISDYDLRNSSANDDPPLLNAIAMLNAAHAAGWLTICLTSRAERWRQLTLAWLLKHDVMASNVFMRNDDDYASAPEYKVHIVKRFLLHQAPLLLIDSRSDVINAYREQGWQALQSQQ